MAILIRNLQSGLAPKYGDEVEGELRRKLLDDVERLVKVLAPAAPHGGIGHNNPPSDDDPPVTAITEIGKAAETIRSELGVSEPNALKIAEATFSLKAVLSWIGKKADVWAEDFAKESGGEAGKWFTRVVVAGVAWRTLPGLVTSVVETATRWLHHVTAWF